MRNATLLMVGIVLAVAMLSAGLSITSVQQASGNVEDGDGGDTNFNFEQKQSNRCSGFAFCANEGALTFGF
jgi:hypothetical protein